VFLVIMGSIVGYIRLLVLCFGILFANTGHARQGFLEKQLDCREVCPRDGPQ